MPTAVQVNKDNFNFCLKYGHGHRETELSKLGEQDSFPSAPPWHSPALQSIEEKKVYRVTFGTGHFQSMLYEKNTAFGWKLGTKQLWLCVACPLTAFHLTRRKQDRYECYNYYHIPGVYTKKEHLQWRIPTPPFPAHIYIKSIQTVDRQPKAKNHLPQRIHPVTVLPRKIKHKNTAFYS